MYRLSTCTALLLAMTMLSGRLPAAPANTRFSAPADFEVTLFADDDLAHDVFALTINAQGDVVVSGPGYIRTLLDNDQDGRAESFRTFAPSPATGAQGLYFDGSDLICTGDGGLLRYHDQDQDAQADGPPQRLISLKTGGEHFAHAVERGPDGWWYVLLGNLAGIGEEHVTLKTSPVHKPRAGVLMRIAPDFSASEVVADGFRNPYDFTFSALGEAYTFDSDGERDVSLPWYRPTRVFQVLPGTHAGWVTASWKQPDYFTDMPATVASCGRGSPTGVICYQHSQFPPPYREALFILDWTFGRVLCVHLEPQGAGMSGTVEQFLTARGQFGFAPTDLAVSPSGDLMISVGGRGTRGGVYRVRYVGAKQSGRPTDASDDDLAHCLAAPQPLSSWSRADWVPRARRLGQAQLLAAARDAGRPVLERIRALEIVVELFSTLDASSQAVLAGDTSPAVRARTAWALGRLAGSDTALATLARLLEDQDPTVIRTALHAAARHLPHNNSSLAAQLHRGIVRQLEAPDRYVRQAAWKAVAHLDVQGQLGVAQHMSTASPRAQVAYALAVTDRRTICNLPAFELAWKVFRQTSDTSLQLDALRAAQKALGDAGAMHGQAEVFDGYCAPALAQSDMSPVRIHWSDVTWPDAQDVQLEFVRLIAMLAPNDPVLTERLTARLADTEDPRDQVHYLIALARLPSPLPPPQCAQVASTFVHLEDRLQALDLQQDRNWDLRIAEVYQQLAGHNPALVEDIIRHPEFGRPGHVLFTQGIAPELRAVAAQRVAGYLAAHGDTAWTNNVVFLLSHSPLAEHRDLVRQHYDDFAVRGAVIRALAERPEAVDRPRFLAGLQSPDLAVVQASVTAWEQLPADQDADGLFALLGLLRRLGADRHERAVRDRVVKLLRRSTGREFGYVPNSKDPAPPTKAIAGWTNYLRQQFPEGAARHLQSNDQQVAQLLSRLSAVNWSSGRWQQGKAVFEQQACYSCHNARAAVGPDLAGVATRFSRDDLFTAIVYPNQDVSPRYTTTLVETTRGTMISGLVIYESVDGLTLLDSTNQTIRVEADEIESRCELPSSLMPAGLLDSLQPQDLADLYAYLCEL